MNGDIGWSGLATSLVLVVVAIGLSAWRRLDLERSIAWASARAIVQLLAIGWILQILFEANQSLAWSWLWVMAMVLFAAETVRRRAREVPDVFPLALAAFAAAGAVSLGVLFGLGVFDLSARTLIPLAGLMIGNSMTATILVARRLFEELRDKRAEVEARPGARSGLVRGGTALRAPRAAHRARSRRSRRRKPSGSSSCRVR